MTIIEHLDLIERLVSEQKPPAEIRGHVLAIREQIETYMQEAQNLSALKVKINQLETEIAASKNPTPPNWGGKPPIRGRMG